VRALLVLALLASTAHADRRLRDRMTLNTGYGLLAMQVDGVMTSGMHVQPALTRTFDRFELHVDYLLGDLSAEQMRMPGATLHRFGFAARYQVGRWRDRRSGTLDLIVEGGIGFQYLALDDGSAFGRNDLEAGIGLRGVAALRAKQQQQRLLMGAELMFRGLVTPNGDKAFVLGFGYAFGR
jgi:hypothetical protein